MDAFPDYTKFDQTHKVLAAIQIIDDAEEEEDEDSRDACKYTEPDPKPSTMVDLKTPKASEVTAMFVDPTTILVTGEAEWNEYDTGTFGTAVKGVEVNMTLPTPPIVNSTTEKYTLVQENPVLKDYYPTDSRITDNNGIYIKTQTLTGDQLATEAFQFLVSDKPGKILITVYEGTVVDPNKLILQYRVVNGVETKTA